MVMLFALSSCAFNVTIVDENETLDDPITYVEDEDENIVDFSSPTRLLNDDKEEFRPASKVVLHYHNDDKGCLKRRFYTWVQGVDGEERKPDAATWTETDMTITLDFSVITEYANKPNLMFIIKVAGTWAGQSEDTTLSYEKYAPDALGVTEVWTIPGEGSQIEIYKTEAETKFPKILTAKFTDFKTIHCEADEKPMYYNLYAFDKNYLMGTEDEQIANKPFHLFKTGTPSGMSFDIKFNYTAKINVQYVIESEYASNQGRIQRIIVSSENLYSQPRFEQYYTYKGDDLGCTYTPTLTTFKVWSPISALAYVNIYDEGAPKSIGGSDSGRTFKMNYVKGGVWTISIKDTEYNLLGKFYTYTFIHSGGEVETIDPYAKASGINGYRGYIYDKTSAEANPEGWDSVPAVWDGVQGYDIKTYQDLSIYEVHIRDLTMDESWQSNKGNKRGTYDAFSEKGTTYTAKGKTVTTGFDHIEELGVNAVQLLPVFDNDNDEREGYMKFNWGYNPLNYNCVEGGYSNDPTDPLSSIKEYKNLIMQYSKNANHTRVIMDVVYNHVASASSSCFTKVMPKYYFRYTENWEYYDGSGCNNEVKSDATMMRKYIVDSLVWWATEYKIKGFRFDLMGLIDTWTLKEAKQRLYAIDKDIYIYGEGWTSGGYHGAFEYGTDEFGDYRLVNGGAETYLVYKELHNGVTPGVVGGFNDQGRNALKGSNDDGYNNNPYPQWGFIAQGDDVGTKSDSVAAMMKGINDSGNGGANPLQTINYASCHDNYTLWDQLTYTLSTSFASNHKPMGTAPSVKDRINASLTVHSIVMMGNAASFIQGGEELYRTKSYHKDSAELKALMDKGTVRPYPDYPHYSSDPDVVIATSEVRMYDYVVSHNSYKSSDELNSFKWDRKIEVDGVSTYEYNEIWQTMIHTKKNVGHYGYPTNCNTGSLNSWGNGDGSTAFAMWVADYEGASTGYYFVVSGRMESQVGIGLNNTSIVFKTKDPISYAGNVLKLAPFTFICYRVGA